MKTKYLKNSLRVACYALLAVFLAFTLSGCAKKTTIDPNANKITIWSFEDKDVWAPIIKSVQASNKGYQVAYKQVAFDSAYESRVLNSILSTGTPDIWAMPNDWVYRHKEKLYPAPTEISKNLNFDKQFVPSIKESLVYDSKVYALAPSVEPLMIYYNPAMFASSLAEFNKTAEAKDANTKKRVGQLLAEPPKIWSDFTASLKYLTKRQGDSITQSGVAMGTSAISNSEDILYLLMAQNETDILSSDLKLASFNLPKTTSVGSDDIPGKRALEFYTSFSNPDSPNYSWNDALGNDVEAFANGKTAMIFGYSSLQETLLQKYPNFKYKKAFVPQVSDDSDKITDFARFTAFGVSKYSKNPDVAWNAVYALAKEKSSDYSSATKQYTSAKGSDQDISLKARSGTNPEKVSLATARSITKGRNPITFDAYIKEAIDAVHNKVTTSQIAIDLAASKITEILRTNEWL